MFGYNQLKTMVNEIIKRVVKQSYNIDIEHCDSKQLEMVTEINVSDTTMDHEFSEWDFSVFPNLQKLDCSYVPISKLNISQNPKLEYLRWEGVRGHMPTIDLSANKNLKTIEGGQDGLKEIDCSSNPLLEKISIFLSHDLRWINLDNCVNLKRISLQGVLIPMVDLSHAPNLEFVDINYMNQYKNKSDEFGPGFPRPFLFVQENFNEDIINKHTRLYDYYCYYLVRVSPQSSNEEKLRKFKSMKDAFLTIKSDRYGINIANAHYVLRDILENK